MLCNLHSLKGCLRRLTAICGIPASNCEKWLEHCSTSQNDLRRARQKSANQVSQTQQSTHQTSQIRVGIVSSVTHRPEARVQEAIYPIDISNVLDQLTVREFDSDIAVPSTLKGTLRLDQQHSFRFLCTLEETAKLGGGILATTMGQGKTAVAIAYAVWRRDRCSTPMPSPDSFDMLRKGLLMTTVKTPATLWIVPNSQVRQLHQAISSWDPTAQIAVWYEVGKEVAMRNLHRSQHVITTPHMNWPWSSKSVEFDMIVFDESHLMEPSSKDGHNKAAHLRIYQCNFRLLVTGTLFTTDSLKGIKNQMLLMGHWDTGLCVAATPSNNLVPTLQRLCIRTATNALQLPRVSVFVTQLSLTPAEKTMYLIADALGTPLLACAGLRFMDTAYTIGTTDVDVLTLPRSIKSTMTPNLLCVRSNPSSTQFSHIPALGDNSGQWKHFLDPKTTQRMTKYTNLLSILLKCRSERTVVFVAHLDVADHIRSISNGIKLRYFHGSQSSASGRMNAFSKFNGDYQEGSVLVCRFIHASTGLNLTGGPNGVSNIIFVEPPGDVSSLNQAIKRVHWVGNLSKSVTIRVLLYSQTQDAQRWSILQNCEHAGLAFILKGIDTSNILKYKFQDHMVSGSERFFVEVTKPNSLAYTSSHSWRTDTNRISTCMEEIKSTPSYFIGRVVNSFECQLTGRRCNILPYYYFKRGTGDADKFIVTSRVSDQCESGLVASFVEWSEDNNLVFYAINTEEWNVDIEGSPYVSVEYTSANDHHTQLINLEDKQQMDKPTGLMMIAVDVQRNDGKLLCFSFGLPDCATSLPPSTKSVTSSEEEDWVSNPSKTQLVPKHVAIKKVTFGTKEYGSIYLKDVEVSRTIKLLNERVPRAFKESIPAVEDLINDASYRLHAAPNVKLTMKRTADDALSLPEQTPATNYNDSDCESEDEALPDGWWIVTGRGHSPRYYTNGQVKVPSFVMALEIAQSNAKKKFKTQASCSTDKVHGASSSDDSSSANANMAPGMIRLAEAEAEACGAATGETVYVFSRDALVLAESHLAVTLELRSSGIDEAGEEMSQHAISKNERSRKEIRRRRDTLEPMRSAAQLQLRHAKESGKKVRVSRAALPCTPATPLRSLRLPS